MTKKNALTIMPLRITGLTTIALVIVFFCNYINFDNISYDTYYLWSSVYFMGTLVILSILYGLYFVILKANSKSEKKINLSLFYTNLAITAIGVVLLTILTRSITSYNFQIKDYGVFNETEIYQNNDWLYSMINYGCLSLVIIQIIIIGVLIIPFTKK